MLITFEGIDYSGKTTQAKLLHQYFKAKGVKSILIREPGGSKISEKIRDILLDHEHLEMLPLTEFLLFSASRAQLVHQIIKPNLKKKVIVICDRYYDSSSAYQGYGGSLDLRKVFEVNDFATNNLKPDITFFINIRPQTAISRAKHRGNLLDRIENKKMSFYRKVYKGFLEIAKNNKKRCVVIDGRKPIKEIHNNIIKFVNNKLSSRNRRLKRK
ncbi:MAG: dTMP kinase [Ignavibacteria bacterium]